MELQNNRVRGRPTAKRFSSTFLELTGAARDAATQARTEPIHPQVIVRPEPFRGGARCSEGLGPTSASNSGDQLPEICFAEYPDWATCRDESLGLPML